jgi:hypothetical protein
MNKEDIFGLVFWACVIGFVIWLSSSSNKPKTSYIKEQFNNGRSIEIPVDESITNDNWVCTGDCSGHEAGYQWASENDISDPSDCGGKSESFIEGCEAFANEQ